MNTPNKLTLLRVLLVPLFIVFLVMTPSNTSFAWNRIVALALFIVASVTDFADGHIARKYGLVTNFGKFLDPLADKFLVLGALISLCFIASPDVYGNLLLFATSVVVFRELAVTSMRLVVAGASGVVVAANIYGKVKTVSQMFFICLAIASPLFAFNSVVSLVAMILQYALMATMTVMTIISGCIYFKAYWTHIDPTK